ncbi:hypothetical protein [Cellulosimicrobium arenosum]|uniref:Uncharacterized protein n=1 Tax=Cellulosimicrobium arenosum TaxID=2708133 RepID=A0A927G7H6_9MICO|nr:hypothetical protein [Cellulosimicrobium arenosum]MBD8078346.1 hypothetical protein [Cellulosimicrobium arenosum]
MSFLDTILQGNRPRRWADGTRYRDERRSAGDGVESADVASFGPMALRRPGTTWTEES